MYWVGRVGFRRRAEKRKTWTATLVAARRKDRGGAESAGEMETKHVKKVEELHTQKTERGTNALVLRCRRLVASKRLNPHLRLLA